MGRRAENEILKEKNQNYFGFMIIHNNLNDFLD